VLKSWLRSAGTYQAPPHSLETRVTAADDEPEIGVVCLVEDDESEPGRTECTQWTESVEDCGAKRSDPPEVA
jgi:hypothetical protein